MDVTTVAELQAAISNAKAGDDIVLVDGTYRIVANKVSCAANGSPQAPIRVRSKNPLGAKIELDSLEGFAVTGASWHFEGLDIRGVCASDAACEHAFHVMGGATGFVLRSSRVHDFNAQLKVNASQSGGTWLMPHDGLVEYTELFDSHARDVSAPVTKLNIDTGDRWVVRGNFIHDFHRKDGAPTYGAFMKSGGKQGLYERNLVLCTKDDATLGTHIGLSFGGGGTGPAFCAPNFDPNGTCDVEHEGGTMRNNVVARCSDVGIYLNRAKDSRILHNTLIATTGIDFRFPTTSGEARGNVLTGAIRNRETATGTFDGNLTDVSQATFEGLYTAPLVGDLRKKGDLSALLGKASPVTGVTDDYCARTRTQPFDLGALQHSLGDCVTTTPPVGTSPGDTPPPGTSSGGTGGTGGSDGGASSSGGTVPTAGPTGDDTADGGCSATGPRRGPASAASAAILALALALTVGARSGRRRTSRR